MGYGIGRVPADVDPVDEAMANLKAAEIMERQTRPGRQLVKCSGCGRMADKRLMMCASLGTVCPDCYDDYSD